MWVRSSQNLSGCNLGLFKAALFCFFKLGSVEQTSERACCSTPQARVVLCGEADATLKSLLVVLVGDVKKHA